MADIYFENWRVEWEDGPQAHIDDDGDYDWSGDLTVEEELGLIDRLINKPVFYTQNDDVPRPLKTAFDLDSFARPFEFFRFYPDEIREIAERLHMPVRFKTGNGIYVHRDEALSLLLYRLALPHRYYDAELVFHRHVSTLCSLFALVSQFVYELWKHLLVFDHVRLSPARLMELAGAVAAKDAPLQNCWGFIDGTCIKVCRPNQFQERLYSGYKKYHCIKYQAIVTPDAMIVHLGGPYPGSRHDSFMLTDSMIESYLMRHAKTPDGEPMVVYGDEGYTGRGQYLQAPHRQRRLLPEQAARNEGMRRPRLCVEWAFGTISNNFGSIRDSHNLRVYLSAVGILYPPCAIFSNIRTVMGRGTTTKSYYGIDPPSLEEYLTSLVLWTRTRSIHAQSGIFQR